MTDINLQEIHNNLSAIAFEAGRMITAANPSSITTGTKLNCTRTPLKYSHTRTPSYIAKS